MRRRLPRRWTSDRGSAGVELVILAPVVVAIVMVGVAGARAIGTRSAVIAVANDAARAAVDAPPGGAAAAAQQAADSAAEGFGLDPSRLTVVADAALSPGGAYTVHVSYQVSLAPMPGSLTIATDRSQPVDPFRG